MWPNENKFIINIKLSKFLGLISLINPNSPKLYNNNVYHIIIRLFLGYIFIIESLCVAGLYFWNNNFNQFTTILEIIINSSFMIYKTVAIVKHSNKIWKILDFTRIDFMKYIYHERYTLEKCRKKSIRLTNLYTITCYFACLSWVFMPFFTNKKFVVKDRKGNTEIYRLNVYNIFFNTSVTNYNKYYYFFHFLELIFGLGSMHFSIIFDTLLISTCFALSSQLETLKNTYSSLGRRTIKKTEYHQSNNCNDKCQELFEDIKMLISDNQNLILMMEQFYDIVRPVILTQIIISSNTQIFMSYMISLNSINNSDTDSIEIIKMICAVPVFGLQLYLICFLFGNISEQKNSVNFAIFSSNWMDMDSKCTKLILFAMRMNNANQLNMKMTWTKVVNLELFVNALRMSYSVFSVLVKSNG
ncbi:odorant receptor 46a-like isoform X2 [Daktulosphaira vitifoliae]|uniref:odorant receptor 46a-like isoform X2 n=1 Tax=Daktulosphaira vitifoliae TaxID=58002 RepID=UPI0021AAFF84|nr:odorant receptor 46a-like isoform X2 [Daktulosphaira vitifoliae]